MRAADSQRIKAACVAAIPDICRDHGWAVPRRLTLDQEGWVNVCVFADDDRVFRFNARDPELPKFQREVRAFDRLRLEGLPVPEVLALDTSRARVPYDVMVCARLPGDNLEAAWPSLSPRQRATLSAQAGELLARIHGVSLETFGETAEAPGLRGESWAAYLRACAAFYLAQTRPVLPAGLEGRVMRALDSAQGLLDEIQTPALVHGDYHLGNLLHDGERISGVLDFEWSFAGDHEYDLPRALEFEPELPGAVAPFMEAYDAMRPRSAHFQRRVEVYRLVSSLEMIMVYHRHFSAEDLAARLHEGQVRLAAVEAW